MVTDGRCNEKYPHPCVHHNLLNIQPTGQQFLQQLAAQYANAHSGEKKKDCRIAGRTHVPGHGYNISGVEVQRELVSMVLGSCSIYLHLHKDDMTASQQGLPP